jgi:phage terminase small subunit
MAKTARITAAQLRLVEPAPAAVPRQAPPEHLSPAMAEWWRDVLEAYDLDSHHLHLLEAACGAWDRMVQARGAVAEHGLTFTDKNGDPRTRPEVAIERDARIAFARLIRELDLDEAPPPEPRGRPPGLRSNRR